MSKKNSSECGQSLLEVTLALIVVALLLCVLVDAGRLFYHYIALREGAAEGAVYASICPPWKPENTLKIIQRIRTSSTFPVDLRRSEVFISITYVDPPARGSQLYVQLTETNFTFITPLLNRGNSFALTATVQMMAGVDECQAGD